LYLVLPLVTLLLIIAFASQKLHLNAMRELVGERDVRAARSAAQAISTELHHLTSSLENIAHRFEEGSTPDEIFTTSIDLASDLDAGILILDNQGKIVGKSKLATWENQIPIKDKYYFDHFFDGKSEIVSLISFQLSPETPIIIGAFYPNRLAQTLLENTLAITEDISAILIDANQNSIYTAGSDENHAEILAFIESRIESSSGAFYHEFDNGEHIVAYSFVPATHWLLVIEEPWENVTSPLLDTTLAAPLLLTPILVLAIIALWFNARQIIQPLQSLEEKAQALSWGDFDSINQKVGGIEEIRRLQNELIHLASKVQDAEKGLKSYIGAITSGQEEERKRIARELHDVIIQDLIALNQRLHLAQIPKNQPIAMEQITTLQNLTDETIVKLRNTISNLRPFYIEDLGLPTAIESLCKEVSKSANLNIDFIQKGEEKRLTGNKEIMLYRIAQEGINNIARHAQANNGDVKLTYLVNQIKLEITDDGLGFNIPPSPADFARQEHFGLLGIHERVELIHGKLIVSSEIGRGTQITITA
ncbi:MAG: sensor histidine kinase, partial [Chloroflexota bacterium]